MKKKEIIIISILIISIILIIFIPKLFKEKENKNNNKIDDNNLINITIEGEINYPSKEENEFYVNYMTIEELKGVTYKEIYKRIYNFKTKYSILDDIDFKTQYFNDTKIYIRSNKKIDDYNNDGINKININTASKEELMTLYGIGEKRSEKIIEYRKNNIIDSYELLKKIIGVSDEILELIKEKTIL